MTNESKIVINPDSILKDINIEDEMIKALSGEIKETIKKNDNNKHIRETLLRSRQVGKSRWFLDMFK